MASKRLVLEGVIGRGMTAEVYTTEQDKVIKLFYSNIPNEWVNYEYNVVNKVNKVCPYSPAAYELVEHNGRTGILYDKVIGLPMLTLILKSPWKAKQYGSALGRFHSMVHKSIAVGLPKQKERLKEAIIDSKDMLGHRTQPLLVCLEKLEEKHVLCHGDFHPGNILMSNQDFAVIDWMNACTGNPAGDVARTSLMLQSPYTAEDSLVVRWLGKSLKKLLHKSYMRTYVKTMNIDHNEVKQWMLPTAAARLREHIPGEKEWLLSMIDEILKN